MSELVSSPLVRGTEQAPTSLALEVVRNLRCSDHLPGVALAAGMDGAPVLSKVLGWASLEDQRPLVPRSRFRVASISKAFTSVALGLLWQEGALDLDDEVQVWVPGFPRKEHPITVRQLAGHLSGLPHYAPADLLNRRGYESVSAALSKFADRPLLHRPGERFSYSSFGWNLLAAVIENAAGIEFLRFVTERVFAPLGMADSVADVADLAMDGRVAFYFVRAGGEVALAPAIDNSDAWAAAGFLSTAEDLVRFSRVVLEPGLLEPRTIELLLTPMRTSGGAPTGYGLGWEVGVHRGHRVAGHGGSHVGATAQLVVLPDQHLTVALLANANSRGLRAAAARVAELLVSGS